MAQAGQMVTQTMNLLQQQKQLAAIERQNQLQHRRLMATQLWSMIGDFAKENPGGLVGAAKDYPDLFRDMLFQIDPEAPPEMVETRVRQFQNGALDYEHLKQTIASGYLTLGESYERGLQAREVEILQAPKTEPAVKAEEKPPEAAKEAAPLKAEPSEEKPLSVEGTINIYEPQLREFLSQIYKKKPTRTESKVWEYYDKVIAEGKSKSQAILETIKEFRPPTAKQLKGAPGERKAEKAIEKPIEQVVEEAPVVEKLIEEKKKETPAGQQEIKKYMKLINLAGFNDEKPSFTKKGVEAKAAAAERYSGWIAREVAALGPEEFSNYYNGMIQRFGGAEALLRSMQPESLEFMKAVAEIIARQNLMPHQIGQMDAQTSALLAQAAHTAAVIEELKGQGNTKALGGMLENQQAILEYATKGLETAMKSKKDVSLTDLVAPESGAYDPTVANFYEMFLKAWVAMLGIRGVQASIVVKEARVKAPNALAALRGIIAPWTGMIPTIQYGAGELPKIPLEELTPQQQEYLRATQPSKE